MPEPLFIKRFHKDTSYYLTTRERAAWIDPEASFRVPQVHVLKGYLKALSLVPLTPSQRVRCWGSIAHKVLNARALRRLLVPSPDNYLGIERRWARNRPPCRARPSGCMPVSASCRPRNWRSC